MVQISNTMRRIHNQPCISTSCSDNALRLCGSCGGQLIMRTSSDIFIFNLGLRFEGLFWEKYILRGQISFKRHWRLQSWTLVVSTMGQSLAANHNWPHMVLVIYFWSGVPVGGDCWCKVVSNKSQNLVFVGYLFLIGHMCKITLGKSILVTSHVFLNP